MTASITSPRARVPTSNVSSNCATASNNGRDSEMTATLADTSRSAWAKSSPVTSSLFAPSSAITNTSGGASIPSISQWPTICRLASATAPFPEPTIFLTRAIDSVPNAAAAIAEAPPTA